MDASDRSVLFQGILLVAGDYVKCKINESCLTDFFLLFPLKKYSNFMLRSFMIDINGYAIGYDAMKCMA